MQQFIRIAFGQGLVILATLVPVVAGQHSALAASVFCSSVAGLLLLPLLASVPTRLPGISDDEEARSFLMVGALVVATLMTVLVLLVVLIFVFRGAGREIGVLVGSWRLGDVIIGVLLLLVGQGLYALLASWYTRQGDMRGIGFQRTVYGATAIVFAGIAVLFGDGFYQVLLASSAALFLSSAAAVCVRHRGLPALPRSLFAVRPRHYFVAWQSGWRLSLAGAANGFTAQAAGLLLPALGGLTEAWAVVLRVGGGFTTIMQTVVAPFIERDLGLAARTKAAQRFRRSLLKGWGLGVLSGVAAAAAGILAVHWTNASPAAGAMLSLAAAAGLLFVGQTGTGAISRAIAIADWQTAQLIWDLSRFAVVAVVVALFSGLGLLLAVAGAIFVFSILFVLLGLRAPIDRRWQ